MGNIAELAAPLAEVREVVETFRHDKIILPGWQRIIDTAIDALAKAPTQGDVPGAISLTEVVAELRILLKDGLPGDAGLVDHIARETTEFLRAARPAELPAPSDDDWTFPATSA